MSAPVELIVPSATNGSAELAINGFSAFAYSCAKLSVRIWST